MLDDGSIMDSVLLPPTAVEGHPVEVSEDSLLQSILDSPAHQPDILSSHEQGKILLAERARHIASSCPLSDAL